jgi:hypothetical protein
MREDSMQVSHEPEGHELEPDATVFSESRPSSPEIRMATPINPPTGLRVATVRASSPLSRLL